MATQLRILRNETNEGVQEFKSFRTLRDGTPSLDRGLEGEEGHEVISESETVWGNTVTSQIPSSMLLFNVFRESKLSEPLMVLRSRTELQKENGKWRGLQGVESKTKQHD